MNKKHLVVKKLDQNNLQDVMDLQQRIIANLHPDEQHFILHRTQSDYEKALNGKSSNMLGVFDGDKLIAQTVYETPSNEDQRSMPEFKSDTPNENLVVFEAILVDPVYRGSSLMKRMLEYIEKNAIDEKRTHSIIQIAIDNPASWINALHYGMNITKVDCDPYDGCKVIYLEKNIKKQEFPLCIEPNKKTYNLFLGENIHEKIPALFPKMQYLIKSGYTGVSLDKETQSLVWQKDEMPERIIVLAKAAQYKKSRVVNF